MGTFSEEIMARLERIEQVNRRIELRLPPPLEEIRLAEAARTFGVSRQTIINRGHEYPEVKAERKGYYKYESLRVVIGGGLKPKNYLSKSRAKKSA